MTQGSPLAVIEYDIILLPLITQLKSRFPKIKSPLYTYDGAIAGTFKKLLYFLGSYLRWVLTTDVSTRKIKLWRLLGVRTSARFMFNINRHQSVLVVRCKSKNNTISLYSSEWVRQRCPLTVVGCGILLLPLIAQLKSEFPKVKSPWYTNDGATAGTLKHVFYF